MKSPQEEAYDVIIIGAGMSGLAAAIRLGHFGKKVLICEKHSLAGGLNSYYRRGKRKFDVGLHALTNFAHKGEPGRPLTKIFKQLRIPYEDFELCQQDHSLIVFPQAKIRFTNNIEVFTREIQSNFPAMGERFLNFCEFIKAFDETNLEQPFRSARAELETWFENQELVEILLCPPFIYGSAWENDCDFSQYVILFKALFFEGFSRPKGGVRTIINVLLKRAEEAGVEISFQTPVKAFHYEKKIVRGLELENGKILKTQQCFSSIGVKETYALMGRPLPGENQRLSFTETLFVTEKKAREYGETAAIHFWNKNKEYKYESPSMAFDENSAVICFTDNFSGENGMLEGEGLIRITRLASFSFWDNLRGEDRGAYRTQKDKLAAYEHSFLQDYLGQKINLHFKDVFTPSTVKRYTWHHQGAVYGSTLKQKKGETPLNNLFIIGTDQGFLGITGALLSGISMANKYGLQDALSPQVQL